MKILISVLSLASLVLVGTQVAAQESTCNAEVAKQQFNKCVACHSTEADLHLMGPSLHGLIGRKVGTVQNFIFSPAMEAADFEWTEQTLSDFLKSPMEYVPGTAMPFSGIKKDSQRESLVCFIKQLH